MPFTEDEIENLLPAARPYKRSDGKGLYLYITPAGSKFWRMNYRFDDRQKPLSLGEYPIVSIEAARAKRLAAKGFLKDGVDPGAVMRRNQVPSVRNRPDSYNAIADEFLEKRKREGIAETTLSKKMWLLDMARPALGHDAHL